MSQKPNIICITPVKNEIWILDRFLKCTSLWADHIIILDQGSTDGSQELALRYPKVKLIDYPHDSFDELERRKILIESARKFPEPRILFALDTDEMLSANFLNSPEWETMIRSDSGTAIKIERVNLLPTMDTYWRNFELLDIAFVDDGSEFIGQSIHGLRVPFSPKSPTITLRDIKVLHYQFVDWPRMQSKHRWYQCWERLNRSHRSAIEIYRQYHHMNAIPPAHIRSLPPEWLCDYARQGIDMTSIYQESAYWWDREVVKLLTQHGSSLFRREAIWDVDWSALSQQIETDRSSFDYADPRNYLNKLIHYWLKKTQSHSSKFITRCGDRLLELLGY